MKWKREEFGQRFPSSGLWGCCVQRLRLVAAAATMATTYENMVLNEAHKQEHNAKTEWGRQHGGDATIYPMDSVEFAKLDSLKSKVADLCDMQPTPAAMLRPPRKVRAPRAPSRGRPSARASRPSRALKLGPRAPPWQEALKKLRAELASSLADVEQQLEAIGGSASTVSHVTAKTAKSAATAKSVAAPSTIAEEE